MTTGIKGPLVHGQRSTADGFVYRARMGMMSSAEFHVMHEDFVDTITTNAPAGWTAIIDTGATVVADTTAGSATGVLYFDSDGATEGAAIYKPEVLQLVAGKRFFMEMRFKTEAADDSDVQMGLSSLNATTNPEDLWTTQSTDVLAFGTIDGSAATVLLADLANAGTAAVTGTLSLSSGTWHTLAIYFDGARAYGYVDGALSVSTATTVPVGVTLAPFIGWRNGSAATTEGQCDYVRIVQER